MAELLRRMLPVGAPLPDDDDENLEYSFALEYHGPPVSYDIPRAVPIDVNRIPTAAIIPTASISDCVSVPVIQPLPSPDPLKKLSKELVKDAILGSDSVVSPTSVIAFERAGSDGCGARELSSEIGSSGTLGFSSGHGGSRDSSPEIGSLSGALGFSHIQDQSCELSCEIGSSRALGSQESLPGVENSVGLGFLNGQDQSCELSGEIGSSGALDFPYGHDESHELSGGVMSSSAVGFSGEHDQSHEMLGGIGSSGALGSSHGCKESLDFSNDMNPPDWVSSESVLSSPFLSSDNSSRKAENCENIPPTQAKRTSLVTFQDAHSGKTIEMGSAPAECGIPQEKRDLDSRIRKGSCYRCLKGNRFTEKEACIVCNAKYCSNCVLRAMGSMPEGRKCVTCIGYPIDESKRGALGKCSRLLKRLLSAPEIQLVMKAEKLCEINQLQPEHVYVNGKQLCQEEMVFLNSCPSPPNKLKPGRYWYDKVSGFWGKEGQKPSKIISPQLSVGGELMEDASNGNTRVFINNREITKDELRMLKWAGVQTAGNPCFWVHADGSYQEEGQKNIRGNIWEKAGTKLFCSFLSLPFPKPQISSGEEVNNLVNRNVPDYLEQRTLQKLLLVGCDGSGTSTIFKQAKFLYQANPFSEEERQNIKCTIQSNVYNYLGILLEGRERFEEESLAEMRNNRQCAASGHVEQVERTVYSISPRLKVFSDWLLKVMVSGDLEAIFPAATREYAPIVEELWKDAAIQATYNRRSELRLFPSVASYFLERVVDISRTEYEPSNMDILYAEGTSSSNGLSYTDFLFPQSLYDRNVDDEDQHDPLLRYELIRVHAKSLGENCKWLEMFEDVRIVIFCVSLSDYDQFSDESGVAQNKMLASKKLFESIVAHPTFEQMDFLLILNKFDLLEQKIEKVPLTVCDWFDDFSPVTSRHRPSNSRNNNSVSLGLQAFHYVAVKFKKHFASLTGRKLYVSRTNGLEADSVDLALRYAREIIKWEDDKNVFSENSFYSTEASSSH